ncbi:HAD family hydrolase [Lentzea sp. NEAU-D13]|uniref:HAD family hydrolase n=1 Tax=Lentzea alba TaxID=2714351 RepID=A0A7C9RSD0_9PSEU|nr:HAD family hydrolase [Lentzea alba]
MNAADRKLEGADVLRSLLSDTEVLFLDFDGPVCSVFAGFPAPVVAGQLREVLHESGLSSLPAEVQGASDPFDVLRYAATCGPDQLRYVEAALRAHEVEAVMSAAPTPYSRELILEWTNSGRDLAIVSNNSKAAVETYLDLQGIRSYVRVAVGRTEADPSLLKPHPHLVEVACELTNVTPDRCTLVGDSVADIEASRAVGVPAIAFANKPGKANQLREARPAAIVDSIAVILEALKNDC